VILLLVVIIVVLGQGQGESEPPTDPTSAAGDSCGVHAQPSADGSACVCDYYYGYYFDDSLRLCVPTAYPLQYVISGSVGTSDGGNLDGVYSLIETPAREGVHDSAIVPVRTCDGAPVYYQEGGEEGNVLYRSRGGWYVDKYTRLILTYQLGTELWCPNDGPRHCWDYCASHSSCYACDQGYNVYGYARRDINPGQQPGAPDDGAAYGAWQEIDNFGRWVYGDVDDVDGHRWVTSLTVQTPDEITTICAQHGTWDGSACVCGPSYYGRLCTDGPYPQLYVISGSVGTSDGGNLDGVYSLVEAHCNDVDMGSMCDDGSPTTCGGRPVYQEGGAEGNVLFTRGRAVLAWSTLYVFDSTALAHCRGDYAYAMGHRLDINLEERQRPSNATYAWKESPAGVPAQHWTDTPARRCGGIRCMIPGRLATAASGRDSPLVIASTRDEAAATCAQHGSWDGSACSSCRDNFAGGFCTDSCGEHGTSDGSVCACDVGFGGRLCQHDLCGRRDQEPSGCCYADRATLYRDGQGHTSFCCHGGPFDKTYGQWRCV
jgi:hypothetical protein